MLSESSWKALPYIEINAELKKLTQPFLVFTYSRILGNIKRVLRGNFAYLAIPGTPSNTMIVKNALCFSANIYSRKKILHIYMNVVKENDIHTTIITITIIDYFTHMSHDHAALVPEIAVKDLIGRLTRWTKRRACDVGEAKEGLENELWRRWSNGRAGDWAVT